MPHWISFLKSPSTVIGHEGKVIRPKYTKMLDHEIELAIIIGKRSKRLTKESALDAIAGFTVFNDITARDIQREEMKSGLLNFGKNLDTFGLFGPVLFRKRTLAMSISSRSSAGSTATRVRSAIPIIFQLQFPR